MKNTFKYITLCACLLITEQVMSTSEIYEDSARAMIRETDDPKAPTQRKPIKVNTDFDETQDGTITCVQILAYLFNWPKQE